MAIDILKTVDIIELMENFLERIRTEEHIRKQLDIGYIIDNQSVILAEIRPIITRPSEYAEYGFAKATYVKSVDVWKIYWMRANSKWTLYQPNPEVNKLEEFLE